jgi:hypothetical protein
MKVVEAMLPANNDARQILEKVRTVLQYAYQSLSDVEKHAVDISRVKSAISAASGEVETALSSIASLDEP